MCNVRIIHWDYFLPNIFATVSIWLMLAGQDRSGLSVNLMIGQASPAVVVVVHTGAR